MRLIVWPLLCLMLLLGGCQSRVDPTRSSQGSALTAQTLATTPYPLQALLPAAGRYPLLRVYVEGDGHAWATRSQPSTDPTPVHSLMIDLALGDSRPSVYLARPCQFIKAPGCSTDLWTSRRFSAPVTTAMNMALDQLKARYGVAQFELVGHSGGAVIALVLAATRGDVGQVQTLAGNLDPEFWTRLQSLSPLQDSMLPLSYRAQLRQIPQRHFVGLEDTVVPPSVAQSYVAALQGQCVQVVSVQASHGSGFEDSWKRNANAPVRCD